MAEATADPIQVGTRIGGVYEVVRLVGRGGTSTVWAARHVRLPEKEVAIKVLFVDQPFDDAVRNRLRHEAQILCRLTHPNIVQVLDFDFLAGGTPYLVLELLHGETLRERLRHGRLPVAAALEIAAQIGSALDRAHVLGVVHRDLKPGNIFLCPTMAPNPLKDHVKVLDFGLSTLPGVDTLTTRSSLQGTPQYMAPEQLLGSGTPIDARADIFAFGAVLYETLTGRAPFRGETLAQVATRVVYATPEPIRQLAPHVPAGVARAVERALEKDPALRYPSVTAFLADLGAATASAWLPARPRRVRPRVLGVGALVLAVGASVFLFAPDLVFRHLVPRAVRIERAGLSQANTLAVMEFENQRRDDPANDWYRQALQTALNTELSNLPQIGLVAPEVIRHSAGETGVDAMSAARQLGVGRFISGSFAVVGDQIRIDARIVETHQGLQEAAEKVEGRQHDFFALQRSLALAVLSHFQVDLTRAQEAAPANSAGARVDKYRLLLEAEGVTTRDGGAAQEGVEPQSRLRPFLQPPVFAASRLALAHAAEIPPEIARAALETLEEYREASQSGDTQRLAALHVNFPAGQRAAVSEYTRNAAGLRVELANVKIEPRDDMVIVSYTRRDSFTDRETGEPVSLQVRLTRFLALDQGRWKFAPDP